MLNFLNFRNIFDKFWIYISVFEYLFVDRILHTFIPMYLK